MAILKRIILCLVIIVVIGLLGISAWYQWNENEKTILDRMRPILPIAEYNHGTWISDITFSPSDPDIVASVAKDNIIKIWNRYNTDSPEITLRNHPTKYDSSLEVDYIAFSSTGEWLVSKNYWTIVMWDVSSGEIISTLENPSSTGSVSPMKDYFAAATRDVKLWNFSNPHRISELFILPPRMGEQYITHQEVKAIASQYDSWVKHHNATVNQSYKTVDFSHDGKWIAAGGEIYDKTQEKWTNKVKIWDFANKRLYKIIERDYPNKPEPNQKRRDSRPRKNRPADFTRSIQLSLTNDIRSIEFSPDNRFFGVAADNGISIWSLPDWKIYHEVVDEEIRDIAFSPDGTMYAVVDVKGITLWSLETITPIAMLKGSRGLTSISVIAFSVDSTMIAGGGYRGVLSLWDVSKINEN